MRRKNIHMKYSSSRLWLVTRAFRTGLGVLLLCCCGLLLTPPRVAAQSDEQDEYRLKLAYLYNFAQFVQWPPEAFHDSAAPLLFCIAGADPFKGEVEGSFSARKVDGHPIVIKRLKPDEDSNACHIIFVRAGQKKLAAKLVSGLKGSTTLTVGETEGFAASGGLINLTLEDKRLRFEINLDAATQTKLKVSAKLLALAKIVK